MITLKKLSWSNCFSYGLGNTLQLDENPITQLLGKNGHGKSSIGLILEEVLYNKNSKGIKKGDILNRYIDEKAYTIELEFEKDGDTYIVKTTRGSTQTVKLTKNGEDISSHTATSTFKTIEEILGFDQKTFSQLIYQSSANSLEFLTATDTNRKKFLIDLLNLSKYVEAFEVFKGLAKTIGEEVVSVESKVSTVRSWIEKHGKEDLTEKPLLIEPPQPDAERQSAATIQSQLESIDATNRQIIQNNQYKKLLDSIPHELLSASVEVPESTKGLVQEIAEVKSAIKSCQAYIKKAKEAPDHCPTCKQSIDNSAFKIDLDKSLEEEAALKQRLVSLEKALDTLEDQHSLYEKIIKAKSDYENYHALYNPTLPSELLDKEALKDEISDLFEKIKQIEKDINLVQVENRARDQHNTKIKVISSQLEDMRKDLSTYTESLDKLNSRLNIIQLLQKTFSTNGLIAYKIECLVKDLEELTNKYLSELSDGRFQISFKVVNDKLNVIITDNGNDIEILALSSGERARVNTATLLAIRRLMQSLSNARINLLILDETIENLDIDGKERLIEVLLQEEHLNTILISHGFSHQLLEKITVVKENNISRIENI